MLTLPQLRALYPEAPAASTAAFASFGPDLFRRHGLDANRQRCHFFLAQIGHESGGLQLREENLRYSAARLTQVWPLRFPDLAAAVPFAAAPEKLAEAVYGGRIGNDRPGDGYRYRGRGFIQITGRATYRALGLLAGIELEARPDLANDPAHALAIACAYWSWKKLNALCDEGDFTTLTRRINGGLTGLQDRFSWLERVQRCLPWPDLSLPRIKAAQRVLKARGLYDGSIDGIVGRRSLSAIAALRQEAGLPPGAGLDAPVLALLGV